MPWWRKFKNYFWLLLVLTVPVCGAVNTPGITVAEATGFSNSRGEVLISAIFRIKLPFYLEDALKKGVPLYFVVQYDLLDSAFDRYFFTVKNWLGYTKQIQYRLLYHPLLNKYHLSVGGYNVIYNNLGEALTGLGQFVNFNLTDALGEQPFATSDSAAAKMRLAVSVKDLPKPFQINPPRSRPDILDSGWIDITINGK